MGKQDTYHAKKQNQSCRGEKENKRNIILRNEIQ